MITEFEPIVQVALGWLAFVVGLDFGRVEGRRVSKPQAVLGIGVRLSHGTLVVALAVYYLLARRARFAAWRGTMPSFSRPERAR